MALTDAYASVPEYRAWKGKQSSDDDIILGWCLEAISRLIDLKTNQPYGFNKDAAVTTRVYGPKDLLAPIADTTGLIVKAASGAGIDWSSVTALVIDEDFELLPRNPRSGWPYTGIGVISWNAGTVLNPKFYRASDYRLQITAIHGWPEVPKAIKWATVELTAMLGGESIFTSGQIQNIDQVVDASPQARGLLKDLMRQYDPLPLGIG